MLSSLVRGGIASAALAIGLAATPAWAADDAEGDANTIIVTAQKREEAILDIPQSVTVVSGETLERQSATSFQDYLNQVPGLSLQQSEPGVGRLVLRGVNTGGVASTVSVYVDETPFGSSSGLVNGAILAGDFDTFDVARIEVLRGPQGTLYGASSLGGVLKFVTGAPQLGAFSARARGGVDFVDGGGMGYNVNGLVNAPLGETAALRVSGSYRKRAGWVDAVAGEQSFLGVPSLGEEEINEGESWSGRASLLFEPSDRLSIRITGIAQNIESDGSNFVDVDEDYEPLNADGEYSQSVFIPGANKLEYRVINGTLDYDFGFASLISSTSYAKQDQTFRDDYTQLYGTFLNYIYGAINPGPGNGLPDPITDDVFGVYQDQLTNLSKFTQELRLVSPESDTLEWLIGAYYTREKGLIDQYISSLDLVTRQQMSQPDLRDLAVATASSRYREIAGFANATWHITDRFDITAGGRWSENKQSSTQTAVGSPFLIAGGSATEPTARSKENVFTWSVSPRFELSDTTAVYARVAKGYRPGGPNILPPTAGPDVPRSYDADTITSYEIGLKSDIGQTVSIDISAYHLKWKDIQLFAFIDNFGVNANGSGAESNGAEASLQFRPVSGLTLGLNGSIVDAELTANTDPFVGGFDGDKLPYVPKSSFSLTGDYEWSLSDDATAYFGGTLAYVGKQRGNFEAGEPIGIDPDTGEFIFQFTDQRRIPSYTTVDLRAGVQFGAFSVDAFVRNLTNADGVTSLNDFTDELTGDNLLRASFIQPRTFGITVGAEF
jgi:outer membrane receptor protein involved in Fe transport